MPGGSQPAEPVEQVRPSHLNILFVKIASMAFEIQRQDDAGAAGTSEKGPGILAEQKKILRNFVPFVTTAPTEGTVQPAPTTYSGVFFTGDRPNWIVGGDKTGVQVYPSGHGVVHAFTACSLWDSRGDFLLYTEEVGGFAQWSALRLINITLMLGSMSSRMGTQLPTGWTTSISLDT